MWCTYSSICWSNLKRFLSVLVAFGRYFDLKMFTKIQKFATLHLHDSLTSHAQVAKIGSLKLQLTRDYLASISPSREKDLEIFFQNLGLRVFGNSLGNSFTSQLSRENRVFCKNRVKIQTIFQNFSLSLASRVCPFVFSPSPSLKTTFFTPKTSILLFNLHSKSKKRYVFSLLFTLF